MKLDKNFDHSNEDMGSDRTRDKVKEKNDLLQSDTLNIVKPTKNVVKTFLSPKNPAFGPKSRKTNEMLKKCKDHSKNEEDEIVDSEEFSDEIVNSSQESETNARYTSKNMYIPQKKVPMILQLFELSSQDPVIKDEAEEVLTGIQFQNTNSNQIDHSKKRRKRSMIDERRDDVPLQSNDIKINSTLKTENSKSIKNKVFSIRREARASCLENQVPLNKKLCPNNQSNKIEQDRLNDKNDPSLKNASESLSGSKSEDKKIVYMSKGPKPKPRLVTLPPRKGPFLEMWPEDEMPRGSENKSLVDAEIRFMISCGQRPAILSNIHRCPERPSRKAPFLASEDFAMLVWMARVYPIEPRRRSTKVWKWAEQHELTSRPWDSMRSRVRLLTDYLENHKPLPDDLLELVKRSSLFTVSGNVITSVVSEEVERQNLAGEQDFREEAVDCSKFLNAEVQRAAIRYRKKHTTE